jgi:hypothetical protein
LLRPASRWSAWADEPEVAEEKEQSRYEVHLGDEAAAIADYVK